MAFEMQVVSNTPLIGDEDLGSVAKKFFEQIGYLSKGSDPTIPYKIFSDFFLEHQQGHCRWSCFPCEDRENRRKCSYHQSWGRIYDRLLSFEQV
ncbi:hypothetical protein ES703_91733 [subsurface metagenome]